MNLLSFLLKALRGYHFSSTCRGQGSTFSVSPQTLSILCFETWPLNGTWGLLASTITSVVVQSLQPQHQFTSVSFSCGKGLELKPSHVHSKHFALEHLPSTAPLISEKLTHCSREQPYTLNLTIQSHCLPISGSVPCSRLKALQGCRLSCSAAALPQVLKHVLPEKEEEK